MSIHLNGVLVTPTIFPDGTSQVWNLKEISPLHNIVTWEFEGDYEIFQLAQLAHLLKLHSATAVLDVVHLPYGRQDKGVCNDNTFALHTFSTILNTMKFDVINTYDAHSGVSKFLINNLIDRFPKLEIEYAMTQIHGCLLAFPDAGALKRYDSISRTECVVGDKVRDQKTGYITSYNTYGADPKGRDILIVDDICDGGMTFRLMSKQLLTDGAKSVNLYVSQGIFSKGIEVLREDGISRIFTLEGEIK